MAAGRNASAILSRKRRVAASRGTARASKQISAVEREQHEHRAGLGEDLEGAALGLLQQEERAGQQQVTGRPVGQELREPLDDAEHHRFRALTHCPTTSVRGEPARSAAAPPR